MLGYATLNWFIFIYTQIFSKCLIFRNPVSRHFEQWTPVLKEYHCKSDRIPLEITLTVPLRKSWPIKNISSYVRSWDFLKLNPGVSLYMKKWRPPMKKCEHLRVYDEKWGSPMKKSPSTMKKWGSTMKKWGSTKKC